MNNDDDLVKALESAMASAGTASEPAETQTQGETKLDETAVPADGSAALERKRDETGKFVAKEAVEPIKAKGAEAPAKTTAEPAKTAAEPAKATDGAKPVTSIPPPQNWRGNAKIEWARLPQHIQKELSQEYTRMAQVNAELQEVRASLSPERAQALTANYGGVGNALKQLFALSDYAGRDPKGFLQWFAQQQRIDLSEFAGRPSEQGAESVPAGHPLERTVKELQGQIQNLTSYIQQAQQAPILSQVEAFAADPAHPYFNDVANHMLALIQSGTAKGPTALQNAYDEACWAHPEVRATLLEQERQRAMEANAAKITAAKKAGGSITGSPSGGVVPSDEAEKTLEAELRKQFDRFAA